MKQYEFASSIAKVSTKLAMSEDEWNCDCPAILEIATLSNHLSLLEWIYCAIPESKNRCFSYALWNIQAWSPTFQCCNICRPLTACFLRKWKESYKMLGEKRYLAKQEGHIQSSIRRRPPLTLQPINMPVRNSRIGCKFQQPRIGHHSS